MLKLKNIDCFLLAYVIFALVGAFFLFTFSRGELVLWFNQNSTDAVDRFFLIITLLGWGGCFVIPVVIAFFVHRDYAITGIIALLLTGVFSRFFKDVLFPNVLRPTAFFTNGELTHFIDGYTYHSLKSFPSGHTTTGFAMMLFVSLLADKKWVSVTTFLLALLIGVSRIYLLQHFFIDVYVGAALGVLAVLIGYWAGCSWRERQFSRKSKMKKSEVGK